MRTMMTLIVLCVMGVGVGRAGDDDRHRMCPVVRCSNATITVTCPPLPAPVCTCASPQLEPRCKRCRQLPNGEFLCHGCSLVVPGGVKVTP